MSRKFSLLLTVFLLSNLQAADSLYYYLVYFKDKKNSEFSISHPEKYLSTAAINRRIRKRVLIESSDLPVNKRYIDSFKNQFPLSHIINQSKWLNAIEVSSENTLSVPVNSNFYIENIKLIGKIKSKIKANKQEEIDSGYYLNSKRLHALKKERAFEKLDHLAYNKSYQQNALIGIPGIQNQAGRIPHFHIAVFDAGFHKAYRIAGMEDLLDTGVIIKDFVDYDNSVWEDDQHGCNVLSFMKTFNPGTYIGSAPFAKYSLMRTEDGASESPLEEINWLFAAEFADSIGVDLIIASVGYHTFDKGFNSHTHEDLDGKTSIVAQAANWAYSKGIMVVSSAGNEGSNKWHKIGTPADAPGSIAVGACDENGFYARFSSVGPTADGRIKPDFVAPGYKVTVASAFGTYAGNGTSYATPILAGGIANLMSLFPFLSNDQIRKALVLSACHHARPDSAYGYGLPNLQLAMNLLGWKDSSRMGRDLFWVAEKSSVFQDMSIYFLSASPQAVKLKIQVKKGKKVKTIYKEHKRLGQDEWYINGLVLDLIGGYIKKKRLATHGQTLILSFDTENGHYERLFKMNNY